MNDITTLRAHGLDPILFAQLTSEHAADIIDRINDEDAEDAAILLAHFPLARAVDVFDRPELQRPGDLLLLMPSAASAKILTGMSADRAAAALRDLDAEDRSTLLLRLDFETAAALKQLLTYPEGTAGALMTTEFVSIPPAYSAAQALQHIREVESTRETVYAVHIQDPATRKLLHIISLRQLISVLPETNVMAIAPDRDPVTVHADASREETARIISVHDLLAVPVLNDRGQVLGIVTVDDVIDAIIAESTEDAQKFGGMEATAAPYLQISFLEMIRKRAGWLSALFIGEMLTASAMQHFEDELAKAVVLTLFIPLIMSSGGNSGSQATSLLIRALALGQLRLRDWWRVALREIPTGLTLGVILALVGVLRITAWQTLGFYDYGPHWVMVAATVGAGLIGIVTFGSLAGSMLPFALKRLGFDPASASAPFVATLVDVTGLVIYFSMAMLILRGTLL